MPQSASASAATRTSGEMLQTINQVRQAHGLSAVRQSRSLRHTAFGYAGFMLRSGYFGHQRRIRASSRFNLLGEILAMHRGGRAGIRATVGQWLRSPPHRYVILNPRFRYAGAGFHKGRFTGRRSTTWVVQFGR